MSALGQLAEFGDALRAVRRDVARLLSSVGSTWRRRAELRAWVRGLPTLTVPLSDSPLGDEIICGLARYQPWPFRYRAVAVMELPATFAEYLRGRPRQAARTNRTSAQNLGMQVVRPDSPAAAADLLDTLIARQQFDPGISRILAGLARAAGTHLTFVVDAEDVPIAVASVIVDGRVAFLSAVQVGLGVPDRSSARYLLSTEIVAELVKSRATHLLADSMLLVPPGVVYLEERLGFRPTNIAIAHARRRLHLARARRDADRPQ